MAELLKNLSGKVIKSELFGIIEVHSSWNDFIDEIKDSLSKVEDEIKEVFRSKEIENNFTPKNNVLHFLTRDLKKTKVIVLGQDPYPKRGVATGRAFEIKGFNSWDEKKCSLKNIIKAIYIAYFKSETDRDEVLMEEVREVLENKIIPIEDWFEKMEDRGVLFLNTAFTCKVDESNYHRRYWKYFTPIIIDCIITKKPGCTWFVWGNSAKKIMKKYKNEIQYTSSHPVIDSFIYENNGFRKTKENNLINWLGE